MFRRSIRTLAIATALMGLGSVGAIVQPAPMVSSGTTAAVRKTQRSGTGAPRLRAWGYLGPGITMAQQQRAARKKRNRARHKARS